jgi:hypothetical protein
VPQPRYIVNGANLAHSCGLVLQAGGMRREVGDFGILEDGQLTWESDRQAQQKAEEAAERKKRFQSGIVGL